MNSVQKTQLYTVLVCLCFSVATAFGDYCGPGFAALSGKPLKWGLLAMKASAPDYHVYSTGYKKGTVRVMTLERFKTEIDAIAPDTIVVLDRLPGEMDPPFVAGIITSEKLPVLGTHAQEMFRAIDAPLLHIPGAADSEFFRNLDGKTIVIRATENEVSAEPGKLEILRGPVAELQWKLKQRKKTAILPAAADRSTAEVVPWQEAENFEEHLTGQKFGPLAFLRGKIPREHTPEISAISTGFWEGFKDAKLPKEFLKGYRPKHKVESWRGIRLSDFIEDRLDDAVKAKDEASVQIILQEVRDAIWKTPMSDFQVYKTGKFHPGMKTIHDALEKQLGGTNGKFSFRSNNEMEDFLGAGVYTSSFGEIASDADLERMLKTVWSSLYTQRAFYLRRHFNLREENNSMAILAHRYLGEEAMNGVAAYSPAMPLEINAIRSAADRATSPGAHAKGLTNQSDYSPEEKRALAKLSELMKFAYDEYAKKVRDLSGLKFEWILKEDPKNPGELTPVILQMKRALTADERNRLLYGQAEDLTVPVDRSIAGELDPVYAKLRKKKVPQYSWREFVPWAVKGKRETYFPYRICRDQGKILPTGWKKISSPHFRTAGDSPGEQLLYGYLQIQMRNQAKVIDSLKFISTKGPWKESGAVPRAEALKVVLESLAQIPPGLLSENTIITLPTIGGSDLPSVTYKKLKEMVND